jgi:outer membrane protein assembly factor BamB
MKSKINFALSFFVTLLILFMDTSVYAQDWPMLNFNRERTSWAFEETELHPPLQQKNEYEIKSSGTSIGAISFFNNLLCLAVQNEPNTLEVFDLASGDTLWTFEVPGTRGSMSFTCAQNDSLIFAGGQLGLGLYALDRETGQQRWHKPIGSLYTKNIILDNDYGYILGDSLYCLTIKDGTTVWSQNIVLQGTPAVDDLYVYVVGLNKIQIFNKLNGELLWWKTNSQSNSGGIAVDDFNFYTLSNDTVFAFNKESRDSEWFYPRPGDTLQVAAQNAFAITDSKLCFTIRGNGDGNGQLVTLDKATGEFLWEHTFIGNYVFAPVIANGVVYIVPFVEKALYGFDLESGAELFYDNSAPYRNQPIVANHKLYAIAASKIVVFGNIETKVDDAFNKFPYGFELLQNYPNPFNPETRIKYAVSKHARVILRIINLRGQQVRTLVNEEKPIGIYEVTWDGKNDSGQRVASGIYLYRLESSHFIQIRKMVVLQ